MNTKLIKWQFFRENAFVKNLSKDGICVDLIKLKPNSQFDEHTHNQNERLYILKGSFSDQNGIYSKGHFIFFPKGSKHATKSGEKGCEILVIKEC